MTVVAHPLADAAWLDLHFAACRAEYEHMVELAGFQPGWHVLDTGCATGTHLATLAHRVAPGGTVTGCDIDAGHVATARQRSAADGSSRYRDVVRASVTALPFDDGAFDGAWCANVLQYVGLDDALRALGELRRVVRSGGRVAVKDSDMLLWRIHPGDPLLLSRLTDVSLRDQGSAVETAGAIRGRRLRRILEHAGLTDVRQHTMLIERWAPLTAVEQTMYATWLRALAAMAEQRAVEADDLRAWQALARVDAPEHPLHSPEFYACEGQVVAVGRVP